VTAVDIRPASGTLGVLTPGMGAVATTFYSGVFAVRKGLAKPFGSLTQLGHIRLGKRTEHRNPLIRDFVPLAALDDLVFGGWDPIPDDAYSAAVRAGVLTPQDLAGVRDELAAITPMPAVFSHDWVKKLEGAVHVKTGASTMDLAEQLMADIERFRREHHCARLVMVWCGSTEAYHTPARVHQSLAAFEKGLKASDPQIAPSQVYAYAALRSGVPFARPPTSSWSARCATTRRSRPRSPPPRPATWCSPPSTPSTRRRR